MYRTVLYGNILLNLLCRSLHLHWPVFTLQVGPREANLVLIAYASNVTSWTASSEFGTYRLCEQRRFRRACASAESRQNLRCSLIQAVSQEEPSARKPDPWPLWMAGHAQLTFVMTECSKTQIRLTGPSLSHVVSKWQGFTPTFTSTAILLYAGHFFLV